MTTRTGHGGSLIATMLCLVLPMRAQAEGGAADHYRRIAKVMREQFGADIERLPGTEHDELLGVTVVGATTAEWRAATKAVAPVFEQWQLARAQPRCRFRPTSSEPLMTEFVQDLLLPLQHARQLVVVRGLQAIADRDAATAVATIDGLLVYASHLRQEPGGLAWAIAAETEKQVVALHREVANSLGEAAATKTKAAIQRHLARRPALAAAGAAMRIETFRLFDESVVMMQKEEGRKGDVMRALTTDVRREFTARLDPVFATADAIDESNFDRSLATLRQQGDAMVAEMKKCTDKVKALDRDGPVDVDAPKTLALFLATMIGPSLDTVLQEQKHALDALREVAR